jgi:hypothetical protein
MIPHPIPVNFARMRPLALAALLTLLFAATATRSRGQDTPDDLVASHERAAYGMVRIESSNAAAVTATGWLLEQREGVRPVVITNAHVAEAIPIPLFPEVIFYQGSAQPPVRLRGRFVYASDAIDFAVIALNTDPPSAASGPRALSIETADVRRGERIVLGGNPNGWEFQTTEGVVSGIAPSNPACGRARNCIMVDAASMSGSSGGPALNRRGRVIGMLWGGQTFLHAFGLRIDNPAFSFLIHARVLEDELATIARRGRR